MYMQIIIEDEEEEESLDNNSYKLCRRMNLCALRIRTKAKVRKF
jgi:hypothetical protein